MTVIFALSLGMFAFIFLGGYAALRWKHEATPRRLAALYVAGIAFPVAMCFVAAGGEPLLTLAAAAFWILAPVLIILRASSVG